jgi:hypothetical protein
LHESSNAEINGDSQVKAITVEPVVARSAQLEDVPGGLSLINVDQPLGLLGAYY